MNRNRVCCRLSAVVAVAAFLGVVGAGSASGQDDPFPIDKKMQAERRVDVYLTTFINGYAGDPLPRELDRFEKFVKVVRDDLNFSAILIQYGPERVEICKKLGMKVMIDLLAGGGATYEMPGGRDFPKDIGQFTQAVKKVAESKEYKNIACRYTAERAKIAKEHGLGIVHSKLGGEAHVYRTMAATEALCRKLRGDPTVQAYHLWSDRFGAQGKGRTRDINNVHKWDPTHATLCGTYSGRGFGYLAKADLISNYNFSWKRGPHKNFRDLVAAWNVAKRHDVRLGRYVTTDAGLPGRGNPNRLLYIQNTSILFGLRACMWHIGSRIMNMGNFQLNQYGRDVAKVNAYTKPMWEEIPKLGLPKNIYSTPWTIDWNHRPVVMPEGQTVAYPPYLDKYPFPKDFWIQPVSGEFLMGYGSYNYTSTDYAYIANHDAYGPQDVKLKLGKRATVRMFDRAAKRYVALRPNNGVIGFKLEPGGGEILLFDK